MNILSLHTIGHDTAIAFFRSGKLVFALETERITRKKHDNSIHLTLEYIFKEKIFSINEIDIICFSTNISNKIAKIKDYDRLIGSISIKNLYVRSTSTLLGIEKECYIVSHEACHAMAAVHYSNYTNNQVILVNEGRGTFSRNSLFYYSNNSLIIIETDKLPWYASGFGWSVIGHVLGYEKTPSIAGTLMAMSAYGSPKESYIDVLMSLEKNFHLRDWNGQLVEVKKIMDFVTFDRTFSFEANLVSAFQRLFTEAITNYIHQKLSYFKTEYLGLSGGCALNIICNSSLYDKGYKLSIPPICNDSGQAIGAGLFVYNIIIKIHVDNFSVFSNGISFNDVVYQNKLKSLTNRAFHYEPREIAKLLSEGAIVSFFQNKSELGPRALGNRSILGCSENLGNRKKINSKIKDREWFRPLAGVIREETFLKSSSTSFASPYMLFNFDINSEKYTEISHEDGTCRVQTVTRDGNSKLYELLYYYEEMGGSFLINTSLNARSKAICYSPSDVFDDFSNSQIDYFVFDNIVIPNVF